MFIWISSIVLSVLCIIWIAKKYQEDRKYNRTKTTKFYLYDKFLDHGIDFVVTVVGIAIALHATNVYEASQERQQAQALLNSLYGECYRIEGEINNTIEQIEIAEEQNLDVATVSRINPISRPIIFDNLVSNRILISNMNVFTYTALLDLYSSSLIYFEIYDDSLLDIRYELEMLRLIMKDCRNVIALELNHSRTTAQLIFGLNLSKRTTQLIEDQLNEYTETFFLRESELKDELL